jgi:hypothetical protein
MSLTLLEGDSILSPAKADGPGGTGGVKLHGRADQAMTPCFHRKNQSTRTYQPTELESPTTTRSV